MAKTEMKKRLNLSWYNSDMLTLPVFWNSNRTLSNLFCTVQLPRNQFPARLLKGHIM